MTAKNATTANADACARPECSVRADEKFAWFDEGELPRSREDRFAEGIAMVALLFALAIGFVIALLPTSAKAATVNAAAAPASAPSLELAAFKVIGATPGQPEHLVPAKLAHGGDQLEYQAVYRNPTSATLHHVQVTVPVPATGVDYVLDTATPPADLASTDGKRFAPLPLQRVETTADGHTVTRPAPGADYRFLRWDLGDVPAGATRTLRSRVQLLSTSVATR